MKARSTIYLGVVALALVPLLCAPIQAGQSGSAEPAAAGPAAVPEELPLRAAEVVRLAKAGVGDDVVIAFINNAQTPYNLSAQNILALKEMGLSSEIVAAMLSHDRQLRQPRSVSVQPTPPSVPATPRSKPPSAQTTGTRQAPSAGTITNSVKAPETRVASATPEIPTRRTIRTPRKTIVETPPPAPRYEIVPLSPGTDFYWTPGFWARRGGNWIWVEGAWIQRPWSGAVWVGGHWARHGRGYVWVPGRWL